MVRQRVSPSWGQCFRDVVLWQLADAKEDPGLRENYRLVRAMASHPSRQQRDQTRKIWFPEKNTRSLDHLPELLPIQNPKLTRTDKNR